MGRALLAAGAVLGFIGVAAGAFGAHAVRERLSAERLDNWMTAAHTSCGTRSRRSLAGLAAARCENGAATTAGRCFVAGTVIFSGSLCALALSDRRKLGAITPIGGVLFLVGWALLLVAALRA